LKRNSVDHRGNEEAIAEQQQRVDGIQKIKYGEAPVARSMARILEHVTENYKYSSLQDLNAVLRLYNVEAYRGRKTASYTSIAAFFIGYWTKTGNTSAVL